jgi:hypothetical protein
MILKKIFFAPFCTAGTHKHHLKITELVKRMTTAQETLTQQSEDIKSLQTKVISFFICS